jgi:hypothetical protein
MIVIVCMVMTMTVIVAMTVTCYVICWNATHVGLLSRFKLSPKALLMINASLRTAATICGCITLINYRAALISAGATTGSWPFPALVQDARV